MGLKCGMVGLPSVGKSTVFRAITGAGDEARVTGGPHVAAVHVPDARLERIHAFVETDKIVAAELTVVDIAGLSEGHGRSNRSLGHIKEADALLHIVRCFDMPGVPPPDPAGDIEICELELALADHDTVARNLDRVGKKARTGDKDAVEQRDLFARVKARLGEGEQVRHCGLDARELALLRPLFLLTAKPVLYVANMPDDDPGGSSPLFATLEEHVREKGEAFAIAGRIECELAELSTEDAAVFLEDLGIEHSGLERLIRKAYHLLGLRTFFTAGPKEIKAWTFEAGDKAPVAAGVIHSDFEKKFIRAQIYSVDDLEELHTEAAIKAAGKLRIEGKDYEMRDGDIANFLIAT